MSFFLNKEIQIAQQFRTLTGDDEEIEISYKILLCSTYFSLPCPFLDFRRDKHYNPWIQNFEITGIAKLV